MYECILIMRCKNHFYKKDDHQKCPQTVGNIYLRKGAKIMLYKKKDGYIFWSHEILAPLNFLKVSLAIKGCILTMSCISTCVSEELKSLGTKQFIIIKRISLTENVLIRVW